VAGLGIVGAFCYTPGKKYLNEQANPRAGKIASGWSGGELIDRLQTPDQTGLVICA
jgi:hypothetical protein